MRVDRLSGSVIPSPSARRLVDGARRSTIAGHRGEAGVSGTPPDALRLRLRLRRVAGIHCEDTVDFAQYLNKGKYGFPKKGVVGVESDWLDFGELDVPNGQLWLGDATVTDREEGCTVKLQPGRYVLQLKGMDFKGVRAVSRVRVAPRGDKSPGLGARIGEAVTDSSVIAIVDIDALDAAVTEQDTEEFERDIQETTSPPGTTISSFTYGDRSFDIAMIVSGLGDGAYAVFGLEAAGKTAGVEVEFLPAGYKMP